MATEIIVYRNPLEQAVWNSLMSPDGMTFFLSVMALGITWTGLYVLCEKVFFRTTGSYVQASQYAMWAATGIIGVVVVVLSHRMFF